VTSTNPSHPLGGDQQVVRATVQRIEDKLRESQQQIARIVDSAMDAIVAIDDDQRIVVFNPAAEKMFRCAASDAVGTSLERFLPAHYHNAHREHFFRFRESSLTNMMTGFLSPAWALRADGEEFPIEASIFKSGGEGTRLFVAFVRDITERKRADAILRGSEERFRLAMHNVASGVYTLDLNGLVTYVNPAAEEMFGWTNAELVGRKMHDVTHYKHPDGSPFPASDCPGLQGLQEGVELREHEDTFIRKDGSFFPVVYSASPLKSEGNTVGIVVGFRDDTLRREAERAVRESEERFRLMADAAPVMVWMAGLDRLCTHVNRQWLDFIGRPVEAELGNGWAESVHPDDVTRCLETYVQAFDRRVPFTIEYRLRRRDGAYRWVLDSGVPRFNPDGSFAGYIGSAMDITDQKLATEALSNLSRNLMEAQEKERAWIARELHDDLGQRAVGLAMQLHSCAQVLPNGTSERVRVQKASDQATALVNDIQAFSHRLHSARLEHLGIASASADLCQELSEQHNVVIDFSHSGVPENLSKDIALCLFRVLQEALNNAVKHSGVRHFKVTLRGTPAEIRLEVIDAGRGFDPKAVIGRGLGLISMHERLSLVNGEVSIESRPGGGTTIRARVNLGPADDRALQSL
jgi:PAS domain S-box-containing protein